MTVNNHFTDILTVRDVPVSSVIPTLARTRGHVRAP